MVTALYTLLPPILPHIQLLQALASALGVYYNSSGQVQCLNTSVTANFIDQRGWDFQVHPPPPPTHTHRHTHTQHTHTHREAMC